MSYNTHHFEQEINNKLKNAIEKISEVQKLILGVLIEFLISVDWNIQEKKFNTFLQLLAKIRFNIDACARLIDLMKDDYRFKTSLNVLYRAIVDDIINIYYLLGFVIVKDEKQSSLDNELSILHIEFLRSCENIVISEVDYSDYWHKQSNTTNPYKTEIDQDIIKEIYKANAELYDWTKNKWKKGNEIRKTSDTFFNSIFPKESTFISESQKIEFIKNRNFERHPVLNYLFKYFSQYQHFSPKMHELLLTSAEYDLRCYQDTLMEISSVAFEVIKVIDLKDKEKFELRLRAIIEKLLLVDV